MASLISFHGVRRTYSSGDVVCEALRGINLEVPQGQFVAIMGASGSGKSTLMNIMGCLDRPSSGTYVLAGYDVANLTADQMAVGRGELLGFVFQSYNLLSRTSALENVEAPLAYRGMASAQRRELARNALMLVGLGSHLESTPAQLSGGQQQRVAIARALVTDPALVLADEPTGNLDSETADGLLALLEGLHRERGLTIVLVTHDPAVAARASRVLTMKDGLIVGDSMRDNGPASRHSAMLGSERSRHGNPLSSGSAVQARRRETAPQLGLTVVSFKLAFRIAARSLLRSKLRTTLTALGIMVGIAAVVTTGALGAGATDRVRRSMTALGANLLVVIPVSANVSGARESPGGAATLTEDDANAIAAEIPSISAVAPVTTAAVQVVAGPRNAATRISGTTLDYFRVREWPTRTGALWGEAEQQMGARVCAIGESVRRELFDGAIALGREIRAGALACTVVAVLAPKGQSGFGQDQDDVVIVPLKAFRATVSRVGDGQVGVIMVSALSPELVHRAQLSVSSLLRQRHRIAPRAEDDFQVNNLSEILDSLSSQTQLIAFLLLIVASISLVVGGIGVMNIMLVSVTERTREIGIRLSIGAAAKDIFAQFLVEAVMLAAVGGILGLLAGVATIEVMGQASRFSMTFQADSALVAIAFSSAVGTVFGFLPARRAARLDPIAALRHE